MTHEHRTPQRCSTCESWPPYAIHLAAGINWLALLLQDQRIALAEQHKLLARLDRKLNTVTSNQNATQADIDALTESVNTDRTAIATVVAELNTLIAAGQPVQVADLQAAVSGLTSDIAADDPSPGTPAA